jgi:hypothetical protein
VKRLLLEHRPGRALSSLLILTVLVTAWFLFLLSLSGMFFYPLVAVGLSLLAAFAVFVLIRRLLVSPMTERLLIAVFFVLAVAVMSQSEPSIYTGRDQGTLAMAAELLATHGSFLASAPVIDTFFDLHEPGPAQNFPGFAYTKEGTLVPQFPLAYPALLGGFILLLGLPGIAVANGLLFFAALFIFYELLALFTRQSVAFGGTTLFALSFLPLWFSKLTLSENLALPLFLAAAYFIISFRADGKYIHFVGALLSSGMFLFTRVEGIYVFLVTIVLLIHSPKSRELFRTYPKKSLLAPALGLLLVCTAALPLYLPHGRILGKAALRFLQSLTTAPKHGVETASALLSLLGNFFTYGFLFTFFLALIGIVFLIRRRAWPLLIPALLALPGFAYVLFPNITPDHPWLLRRFLFLLYPAAVFTATIFLSAFLADDSTSPISLPRGWRRRLTLGVAVAALLVSALPGAAVAFPFAEHRGLYAQTAKIAARFGASDLILIDRETSGSGYALLSGPLFTHFGKQAAYIFNPADLDQIDLTPYTRAYLIAPVGSVYRYAENDTRTLVELDRLRITDSRFETLGLRTRDALRLPRVITTTTAVGLFEIR